MDGDGNGVPPAPPEDPNIPPPGEGDGRPPVEFRTVTDAEGYFVLKIPAGGYLLTVRARGYEPFETTVRALGGDELVIVKLVPSTANGLVEDTDGDGVADGEGGSTATVGDSSASGDDGGVGGIDSPDDVALALVLLALAILVIAHLSGRVRKQSKVPVKSGKPRVVRRARPAARDDVEIF
jgi:hypothetical protein